MGTDPMADDMGISQPEWHPVIHDDEDDRVADLHRLNPGDLKGRPVLDRIVALLSDALGVQNSGISMVDRDHEYFLANTVDASGTGSRTEAFCSHTVAGTDPFVLEDATTDQVFKDHPKVVTDGIRFYAGAPLTGPEGQNVGALCVRDTEPHAFGQHSRELLVGLAAIASHVMQTELDNVRLEQRSRELEEAMEDLRRIQRELLEASKMEALGSLTAGVAHEINTPSQFVGDNLTFLRESIEPLFDTVGMLMSSVGEQTTNDTGPALAEFLDALDKVDFEFIRDETPTAIKQSVDGIEQIRRIVRSLREYSHPGTQEISPANLNEAIESTSVVCHSRWKQHARLEMDLDPNLPEVPCRLGEVNQLVMNLIVNAADAIAANRSDMGLVTIATGFDDEWAHISVTDNGGGIPADIQSRIFDPFFTTKQVGEGTGQGLAISRRFAENHGGTLDFETTPGEGTTFKLALPLDGAPEPDDEIR